MSFYDAEVKSHIYLNDVCSTVSYQIVLSLKLVSEPFHIVPIFQV